MGGFDIAAILILVLLCVIILGVIYFLASWPGRVADERGHPYAPAIQIGGWATLLFGGIFWPFVLMWAYAPGGHERPPRVTGVEPADTLRTTEKSPKE